MSVCTCTLFQVFKHEIAELLNAVLGAVVEYWIISGFIMDRNMLPSVADDLASYIAISCDGNVNN